MKKVAYVFLLAVFVPSLVLACIAIRSLRDQQFVVERQQSLLYQGVADSLAKEASNFLMEKQHEFAAQVETLLREHEGSHLAKIFDEEIRTNWPLAGVGFVVTLKGELLAPAPNSRPEAQFFCADNGRFLGNRESAEVYRNVKPLGQNDYSDAANTSSHFSEAQSGSAKQTSWAKLPSSSQTGKNTYSKGQQRAVVPQQAMKAPVQLTQAEELGVNNSKVTPSEAEFRQLVGEDREGTVARFVEDKLSVLVWCRPERQPKLIFGAQLSLAALANELQHLVGKVDVTLLADICVAVVNDKAKPVAKTLKSVKPKLNWRHPFAATEIGEALPHWEVAVYLLDPAKLTHSARKLTAFLAILIAILVLEIALGSVQIFSDLKRQEKLARQKTDFVSNVSHELKTPLTSIRMFSEMLAEGRVSDPAKQRSYLNIITSEAARLTRLINNVLDFSRMDRGEKKYNFEKLDLVEVVRETVETYRPHLESAGFRLELSFPERPLHIFGDRDALAQVVVNLLSNAEKYSNNGAKEIRVEIDQQNSTAEVCVMDRGSGVPRGSEEKIFEQFYRAHDSLSSGIQGSGLGLTLARQIARAHKGDVVYGKRDGLGSCFTLSVPAQST